MVVTAGQTDGAQIRQEDGGVVGIGANEELGGPAVLVQPQNRFDNGSDEPLGQLYCLHYRL